MVIVPIIFITTIVRDPDQSFKGKPDPQKTNSLKIQKKIFGARRFLKTRPVRESPEVPTESVILKVSYVKTIRISLTKLGEFSPTNVA